MTEIAASAKPRKAAVSFTGGKDSMTVTNLLLNASIALEASKSWPEDVRDAWAGDLKSRLETVAGCELAMLVTFVPVGAPPFKAHPLEVMKLQAAALGLPHLVMEVSAAPTFLDSYHHNITQLRTQHGVDVLVTGDMLDVCSSFMPRAAAGTGVQLLSPLWDINRRLLLELVWAYGMEPVITCVNVTKFVEPSKQQDKKEDKREQDKQGAAGQQQGQGQQAGAEVCAAAVVTVGAGPAGAGGEDGDGAPGADYAARLLGQPLSRQLHAELLLPAVERFGVDEAGEWGEYHTMVLASRLFHASAAASAASSSGGDGGYGGRPPVQLVLGPHTPQREADYAYLTHHGPPRLVERQ
ncbi:hypothetical protein HYH02_000572 [Chlamydomonas schloesseri]|uniref:Diphthine--ammonia ligase n=1 Tax=Chlamydomonas schloesseri TaxID=2026947 RepID=A0A835WVX2_9CHLO|nr:hypothetical protein HYH02_000572 [Chlamydomonas schloesseri]|eukprot:KAG2454735.1 hypothetical protein HYH02_000572 [Chlamydomonas schloesseri]